MVLVIVEPCRTSMCTVEVDRISALVSVSVPNWYFRRTFGYGRKQSYHIRCTFGFSELQLVNSVVTESRSQSLSCGGQSEPDAGNH